MFYEYTRDQSSLSLSDFRFFENHAKYCGRDEFTLRLQGEVRSIICRWFECIPVIVFPSDRLPRLTYMASVNQQITSFE